MTKNPPTPTEILLTQLSGTEAIKDSGAKTIGQYLAKLSKTLWIEEESFSGKRPFGNSGWKHDIAHALILEGHLQGELDEDGYVEDYSDSQFNALMDSVFELLYNADYTTLALPPVPKDWHIIQLNFDSGYPKLVDYYSDPYTKEEAEKKLEGFKSNGVADGWFLYQREQ